MANTIIYDNGAFNLYSSISDGLYFDHALTEEQLREWLLNDAIQTAKDSIDRRIATAIKRGSTSMILSMEDVLHTVAAVHDLDPDIGTMIEKYLTLPENPGPVVVNKSTLDKESEGEDHAG